ncbi:MAG TPA: DUF6789 family protein [Pseudonocardiaceae bacterium]|jgi:hypothetical protein|nr:DUF6789 family protein [Pseudonocardiaceae bacterium]
MADMDNGRRLLAGAGHGALATVAMSAVMVAGLAAGVSPMPKPVPVALVAHTLGMSPGPALLVLAAAAHLAYGTVAGAVFAGLVRRVAVWQAVVFAVVLWVLMGLVWLPYLGWGVFGTGLTPKIAVATLVLHLVYGLTLGLLLARRTRRHLTVSSRERMAL